MLYTHLLLREGELFLKGKNQSFFEKKLLSNLQQILGQEAQGAKILRGRIVLPYSKNHQQLLRLFGIVSYSPVLKVEKKLENIQRQSVSLLANYGEKKAKTTFKIQAKRSDKSFPLTSLELNKLVGAYIEKNSPFVFDPQEEKNILFLEINQDGAYLFTDIIPCFGGLPTGVEGNVALIVENKASLLAGILMMKRGCKITIYTEERGSNQERDISLLQAFDPGLQLNIIKNEMEIREEIIVTGKTLCQKKGNLNGTLGGKLFLYPLIAYSSKEIETELKKYRAAF